MSQTIATGTSYTPGRERWVQRVVYLSWFTIIYNLIEGIVSISFGLTDDSIALAGFGADSLIEVATAAVVLLRFRGETDQAHHLSLAKERRATLLIGYLFLALAALTTTGGISQLLSGSHPNTTAPGLAVSALSLSFMFYLWRAKQTAARALDSATVMKDAVCSLACIKLSGILFAGSLLFFAAPSIWYADAAASLLLSGLIAMEGWETVRAARKKDFSGGCGCAH